MSGRNYEGIWIEPAKTARSKCVVCDVVIEKDAPRLSERVRDIGIPEPIQRYYHLRCALACVPDVLRRGLANVRDVEIDRAHFEGKLAELAAAEEARRQEKYEALQAAERAAITPKQNLDPVTFELTAQLLDDPADTGALTVLADQLQSQGDPRGELIAVQLALANEPRAELLDDDDDDEDEELSPEDRKVKRQVDRRRRLLERFTLPIDPNDRCVWGVGFVRRLELVAKTASRLTAMAAIWKSPSVRLLSELEVTFVSDHDTPWIERLVDLVPPSLRRLELGRTPSQTLPAVPALVAQLPRLQALSLVGEVELARLAHPTLARLELGLTGAAGQAHVANAIRQLDRKKLPKLTALAVRPVARGDSRELCEILVTSGWLAQITHLELHAIDAEALELLESKRKLAHVAVLDTPIRAGLVAKLKKLAREVVAPGAVGDGPVAEEGAYVLHANKPEWGRGRIVRSFSGKLEIEFADGETRVLKADAPFLQVVA
jgi:uncharacterized protein (TIGR02996 family)